MTGITILGATGTVGLNTLAVLKQHPREFEVIALTANRDVQQLASLCIEWCPRYAVMADPLSAQLLQHHLKAINSEVTVLSGVDGLIQVASLPEVNMVMAAIVGSAGLLPTLAAAQAGKRILLANKEALVMSGQLFMDTVQQHQAELLPIDSEHNAIFQCLPIHFRTLIAEESLKKPNSTAGRLANIGVKRIVLTASGGPFRTMNPTDLHEVTPEQACAHPNWKMGRKISVDSATMMNKGLEIIEACWLFATIPDRIQVVLHPQSIIHSLVEYVDGSMLAQLSHPDMRIPIAHALAWPQRMISGIDSINLAEIGRLEFEPLDFNRFPCLRLAYEAMLAGGTTTTILNAANEIAVQAFLQGQIRFTDIHQVIETTLSLLSGREATQLDIILEDDAKARELALEITLKMQ
ncbi:MAG: 1-deoxy-D-xylulose-5-phosphate reductoisomerase [Beggiatoa sp. IS2]|nr:MAG: 1-deoxy-D-xylulose-5-phosphate reductoisomerase [Beggiatoa sp. IS2]